MKIGLATWELNELVADLKSGKSWDEVARARLSGLDPKVLAESDYREYAHREAGIPLPEATPAASDEQATAPDAPEGDSADVDADDDLDVDELQAEIDREPTARRGRARRG